MIRCILSKLLPFTLQASCDLLSSLEQGVSWSPLVDSETTSGTLSFASCPSLVLPKWPVSKTWSASLSQALDSDGSYPTASCTWLQSCFAALSIAQSVWPSSAASWPQETSSVDRPFPWPSASSRSEPWHHPHKPSLQWLVAELPIYSWEAAHDLSLNRSYLWHLISPSKSYF